MNEETEVKDMTQTLTVSINDKGGIDLNSKFDPIETIVLLQTAIEIVRRNIVQESQSRLVAPAGRVH